MDNRFGVRDCVKWNGRKYEVMNFYAIGGTYGYTIRLKNDHRIVKYNIPERKLRRGSKR